jgi:SecD/SecF fusion protein
MSDRKRHGFVLLIVFGLLAASVVALFTAKTELGLDLRGGVQLVYQGEPTPQTPVVTQAALNRAVEIMQQRVDSLGVSQPEIDTSSNNQIDVGLPDVHNVDQAEAEVGTTAQLYFFDWEANVLTPNGKTAASQLLAQDPAAITLSQGGAGGPGTGAGGTSLYAAAKLASKQPAQPRSKTLSRLGPELFLFGAPGSPACKALAQKTHTVLIQGQHCFLAGGPNTSTQADLKSAAQTAGVSVSGNQVVTVPQGTLVLQAGEATPTATPPAFGAPNTVYYVLRDHLALRGNEITNPLASTDPNSSAPDVQFGFNGAGAKAFQDTTATIAHRGAQVSLGSTQLNQHFATVLDNQVLTVPQINFQQLPDGIINSGGSSGADITGGFTTQTAQDLANELRLGALPIGLKRISENQVSATLGSQALHDGVLAGGIGLIVVMLFLLLYYRLLGLIAVSTLLIYAVYFYALIKLIPIVLTLAGIAGLILTIGVAADANIVIFERVKEEIRAGRSVRAGIITGYKKGLTAIIDANVVTIITAFILFVLATQEVQGFAFTLGIGTIVSLFTAVLATQAILMTAGDTKTLARPSALGAGKPRRTWNFDYMGMSRYFFTMSGVILLVGALAVGGRGLKLGIDFTSGTKITTTFVKPVTQSQVQATAVGAGANSPTVQRIGSSGSEQYQISFKGGPKAASSVRTALANKYGAKANTTSTDSVGPTFGTSVAHSAIIAIIASLLVISLYVALRFEWKFAVPVLIALAHDIFITAGVYALTGRQVTVDTVAALLTILGYSLYDTIIVFDRIRENVPRMPRAAFTQIVNRSMSEVITRSLATTTCTLLPIIALLLFGGSQLQDFAFALLIGVASGAYSSIFIASPVLSHWKEREPVYRHRRRRIATEFGTVAPYAASGTDVEPRERAARRRAARLTEPESDNVSAAEFEELKREIAEEEAEPGRRRASTLTRRMARTSDEELEAEQAASGGQAPISRVEASRRRRAARQQSPSDPESPEAQRLDAAAADAEADAAEGEDFRHAPDEVENEGMLPGDQSRQPRPPRQPRGNGSSRRNRRHGRR